MLISLFAYLTKYVIYPPIPLWLPPPTRIPYPPVPLVVAIYGGQTSNINLSQKNFWGPFLSKNSTFYFLKWFF